MLKKLSQMLNRHRRPAAAAPKVARPHAAVQRAAAAATVESLEVRQLLAAWSWQDQTIGLDKLTQNYPNITGAGETVAIIDRGTDYNHPSLGGGFGKKIVDAWNFDSNSWDVMPYDNDSHGTATAGEI